MKKIFSWGILASAALALASCSTDDAIDAAATAESNAIQFATYLGNAPQSRAEVTTSNLNKFGVFASYTETSDITTSSLLNYMFNQLVEKKTSDGTSSWSYTPIKYWPTTQGSKISFFAYAPYSTETDANVSVVSTNASNGAPQLKVSIPADASKTPDFVAGNVINKTKSDKVSFTLYHEMTRLAMEAKASNSLIDNTSNNGETHIVIKSVQFDAVTGGEFYTEGTYTFPITAINENNHGTWTASASSKELDLAKLIESAATTVSVGDQTGGYSQKGVDVTSSTTATSLFKSNDYVYLIPVGNGSGLSAEGKATVTIKYDVVTKDASLKGGYSKFSAEKTVNLPKGILAQGKSYKLTFIIDIDEIKLEASVNAWGSDNSKDIEVKYTDDK